MERRRRSGRQTAFTDIQLVDLGAKPGCLEFLIKAGLDRIPVVAPLMMMMTDMRGTLENSFHVPSYLLRILRDFLKDRSPLYETLEGQRRMAITSGVAQGSINLALEKTEVGILTRRRISTLRPISIGELTIESKPAIKYLGLVLDSKMSFFEQIKAAADRAAA